MTLKDCTKEELLFVIERLRFYNAENNFYARRALSDVHFQRERKKLEKAEELIAYSREKQEEYRRILEPYAGMPLTEIPVSVVEPAAAVMSEIQEADRQWDKLMGIGKPGKPPENCT